MIRVCIILFLAVLISCKSSSVITTDSAAAKLSVYSPLYLKLSCVSREPGVVSYTWQRSKNNRSWNTLTSMQPKFAPDSNIYYYQMSKTNVAWYYRVVANMKGQTPYTTASQYIKSTLKR